MELLGTYSISRIKNVSYEIIFEIPDNCSYNLQTTPGSYTVEIQLKNGQKAPSTNFNTYNFTALAAGDDILIEFIQQEFATSLSTMKTKPIIRIYI